MRRIGVLALLAFVTMWPAAPEGQRPPTLSDDIRAALASGRSARVIVQAEQPALKTLGARFGRGLRRRLSTAMAMDVSPQELRTLIAEGRAAHISGDLPV